MEVKFYATLTGDPINGVLPVGYAEHKTDNEGSEVEVRMRQLRLPRGTSLEVFLDGFVAGTMTVDEGGESRMRWKSEDGDFVPDVQEGSFLDIRHSLATVMSGVFTLKESSGSSEPSVEIGSRSQTSSFKAYRDGSGKVNGLASDGPKVMSIHLNKTETSATITGDLSGLGISLTDAWIETDLGDGLKMFGLQAGFAAGGQLTAVTIPLSRAEVEQLRTGIWYAVVAAESGAELRGRFYPSSENTDASRSRQSKTAEFSGDFDGDGLADKAVFTDDAGTGVWIVERSSDGGKTVRTMGYATDIPLKGDFDGDGLLDLAVYRPEEGVWYVDGSRNNSRTAVRFGSYGDTPVAADFDGDGKDDRAIFRPSTGEWIVFRSRDGSVGVFRSEELR